MDPFLWPAITWLVDHPTPPLIGAFTLAGWFLRRQLERQWSVDLERAKGQFSVELEGVKASMQREHAILLSQHQRELEAYKVGLIAQAEHAKATQDVAKSVALRVAEKRFSALSELHDAFAGLTSEVTAFASMRSDQAQFFATAFAEVMRRTTAFSKAIDMARPFLPDATNVAALDLLGHLLGVVGLRNDPGIPPLVAADPRKAPAFRANIALEALLLDELRAFELMGQPPRAPKT